MKYLIGWTIFFSLWALFGSIGVPVVGMGFGAFIGYKYATFDPDAPSSHDDDDDDDHRGGKSSKAKRVARAGGAFAIGYLAGKKTGV